jgi:hypothetical protein
VTALTDTSISAVNLLGSLGGSHARNPIYRRFCAGAADQHRRCRCHPCLRGDQIKRCARTRAAANERRRLALGWGMTVAFPRSVSTEHRSWPKPLVYVPGADEAQRHAPERVLRITGTRQHSWRAYRSDLAKTAEPVSATAAQLPVPTVFMSADASVRINPARTGAVAIPVLSGLAQSVATGGPQIVLSFSGMSRA